jgi:lysophospholipase L1-like esterase
MVSRVAVEAARATPLSGTYVPFGALPPQMLGARTPLLVKRDMWVMGDSITLNGNAPGLAGTPAFGLFEYGPTSYLAHAVLRVGGRLHVGRSYATAGATPGQIKDAHLATVVDGAPAACAVLAGTNGVASQSLATIAADLTAMYTALLAAGTVPILCTIPPQNTLAAANSPVVTLNSWIRAYAQQNGLPLADFYAVTVNASNGEWKAGYSSDGVHPSEPGAEAMGIELARVITATWPAVSPDLPWDNLDGRNMLSNGLLMLDSNADGHPDTWGLLAGMGTSTVSLTTAPAGFPGQVFTGTRGDTDLLEQGGTITLTPGNRYRWTMVAGATCSGSQSWTIRVEASNGAGILFGWPDFHTTVPTGVTTVEFVCPSLSTYSMVPRVWARDASGAVVRFGAHKLVDLTAAGLA